MSNNNIDFEKVSDIFRTPLYLYNGEELEKNFNDLRNKIDPSLEFFFSLKSNPNISIYSFLKNLGARAEVSSLTELKTVLKCNTAPKNIIFLGPGKSLEEIEACINHDIYAIVCESFQELEFINKIACEKNKIANVAIRINPSFCIQGAKLTMGGKPRQFGIDEEALINLSEDYLRKFNHISFIGFQAYMGTRILDENIVIENTKNILRIVDVLSNKLGIALEMVDIGGGLGVPYFDNEKDIDITKLSNKLNPIIREFKAKHPNTRMIMELGRYLTAKSGIYITKVLYVKKSRSENFVVTDGGTNHHMAAVGIGSFVKRNFPMENLSNIYGEKSTLYNVSGPLCTPNDTIGKNVMMSQTKQGDLIGIYNSGAYGPTASPVFFLSHGYPAEVLYYKGQCYLIRERDTVESMLEKQHLHELNAETQPV